MKSMLLIGEYSEILTQVGFLPEEKLKIQVACGERSTDILILGEDGKKCEIITNAPVIFAKATQKENESNGE